MHHCIQIPEIVSIICQHLKADGLDGTLASLAQTCRAFTPVAVPELWSKIGSYAGIKPLLTVFGEDLWDDDENGPYWRILTRPLYNHEVAAFKEKAARIRILAIQLSNGDETVMDQVAAVEASMTYADHPLFPNLDEVSIELHDPIGSKIDGLRMLFGHRLSTLVLSIPFDELEQAMFLSRLPRQCPNLTKLAIGEHPYEEAIDIPACLTNAITGWTTLQEFGIASPSPSLLSALSALPNLTKVSFRLEMEGIAGLAKLESKGFPALRHLHIITEEDIATSIDLLNFLATAPLLRSVNITNAAGVSPPKHLFKTLQTVLNQPWWPDLECLCIEEGLDLNSMTVQEILEENDMMGEPKHTRGDKLHATTGPNLRIRQLSIKSATPFFLHYTHILTLIPLCPNLETLELENYNEEYACKMLLDESALAYLYSFICTTLPALTALSLPVPFDAFLSDSAAYWGDHAPPPPSRTFHSTGDSEPGAESNRLILSCGGGNTSERGCPNDIRSLRINTTSSIESPERTANALFRFFPNLTNVDVYESDERYDMQPPSNSTSEDEEDEDSEMDENEDQDGGEDDEEEDIGYSGPARSTAELLVAGSEMVMGMRFVDWEHEGAEKLQLYAERWKKVKEIVKARRPNMSMT